MTNSDRETDHRVAQNGNNDVSIAPDAVSFAHPMKRLNLLLLPLILLGGCDRAVTRRVVVVDPEQWSEGQFRNCALAGTDSVTNLPQLDCDLQAGDTPRSRMFAMDVKFDGPTEKRLDISWTCQRTKESLICRN